jgi:glutamine synthetase
VNTVLSTIVANAFKEFADAIQGGQTPKAVAQEALKSSWKTIFNGNGYDMEAQKNLTEMGLWRFDSGVDAICRFTEPKNVALFDAMKVLTLEEVRARETCMLQQYVGTVEVEAQVMLDMMLQHVIPSVIAAVLPQTHLAQLEKGVSTLKAGLGDVHHTDGCKAKAIKARALRLESMVAVREVVDAAEALVPAHLWTLATYKDLLFIDVNHSASA